MPLETELQTFNSMKDELLKSHEGKFALIHNKDFLGAFDTAENAYNEGVRKFGSTPFLVKRIARVEEVYTNHSLHLGLIRHASF